LEAAQAKTNGCRDKDVDQVRKGTPKVGGLLQRVTSHGKITGPGRQSIRKRVSVEVMRLRQERLGPIVRTEHEHPKDLRQKAADTTTKKAMSGADVNNAHNRNAKVQVGGNDLKTKYG